MPAREEPANAGVLRAAALGDEDAAKLEELCEGLEAEPFESLLDRPPSMGLFLETEEFRGRVGELCLDVDMGHQCQHRSHCTCKFTNK